MLPESLNHGEFVHIFTTTKFTGTWKVVFSYLRTHRVTFWYESGVIVVVKLALLLILYFVI